VLFRGCLGLAGHPTRSSAAVAVPTGLAELWRINGLVQRCAQKDPLSRINNFSGWAAQLAQINFAVARPSAGRTVMA
jgi:hypothetical protein